MNDPDETHSTQDRTAAHGWVFTERERGTLDYRAGVARLAVAELDEASFASEFALPVRERCRDARVAACF